MNNNNLINDKYLGSFLGAAIGDALGWPNEDRSSRIDTKKDSKFNSSYRSWSRRSGGRYYSHEDEIGLGEYSDDTQLLLATARSLRYGRNWSKYFAAIELPAWVIYERGGGGATKRAATTWSKKIAPWTNNKRNKTEITDPKAYFEAGGNGVAMRIMPHVYFYRTNIDEVMQQVVVNGIFTHGHPRALLGATLYAQAMFFLINKTGTLGYGELIQNLLETKDSWGTLPSWNKKDEWLEAANLQTNNDYLNIWKKTKIEIENGLIIILDSLKQGVLDSTIDTLKNLNCFDSKIKGAGTVASLVSLYLFSKFAANPDVCMVESSSLENADTDTLASMAGGLLGALHGSEWIKEEWLSIQDYQYIKKIVSELGGQEQEYLNINYWTENDNNKVKDSIKQHIYSLPFQLGPFQVVETLKKIKHKSFISNLDVETVKFKTNEGQIIFIKVISKTMQKTNDFAKENKVIQSPYLSINQLIKLSNLFPSNFSANQALILIANLMNNSSNNFISITSSQNTTLFNQELSSEQLKLISSYIKQSIMENSKDNL